MAKPKRHKRNPTYPDRALCGKRTAGLLFARKGYDHRVTCLACKHELDWQAEQNRNTLS